MRKLLMVFGVLCALSVSTAEAADRTVGVGKTHLTIASCLAAANAGDRCLLTAGETFNECVVLPAKGNGTDIIIRTDAADGSLPAAGVRLDPIANPGLIAFMPIITACVGGSPAMKTAAGAQHYQLGPGLSFTSNPSGYGVVVELGNNSSSQTLEADQPHHITVDRIYIAGNPVYGQKIGVDLNGGNLTVINSYIEGIAGLGQDAIAVRCMNGTGPFVIENNFLEGAGENFICGGTVPMMKTRALVTAGATTTAATLNTFSAGHSIATAKVGQLIAFRGGGNTTTYHTYIRSCGAATTTGATCGGGGTPNAITYDATSAAPDTGALSDAVWGAIPDYIRIRRNHFFKRTAWATAILGTIGTVTPTASTASGSLPAGTYSYRVTGVQPSGYNGNQIYTTASVEVSATVSAAGNIALDWTAQANVTKYRVYRTTTPGTYTGYFETTTDSATDAGQVLIASGNPPGGSRWQIKNLFEIKYGTHYQIDSNIFEGHWARAGEADGYALWFKSNNSGTGGQFSQTRYVVFENNKIFNVSGCAQFLGRIDSVETQLSAILEDFTMRNNLCYSSDANVYNIGSTLMLYALKTQSPIINLTVENNTFDHTDRGTFYLTQTGTQTLTGFIYRNNISRKENYAMFGPSCVQGTECLQEQAPGYIFGGQVMAGGWSQKDKDGYPASSSLFPTVAEFESSTHFEDWSARDYRLKSGSTWLGTGMGGVNPGANVALINTALTGVLTGAAEGTGTAIPPNITTATPLTSIVQSASMSTVTFAATGGTTPYAWAVNPGSTLPAGLSLSSGGVLSGTPTTPGAYTFTIRATDAAALTDTQAYQLTVTPASGTLAILTSATLAAGELNIAISTQLQASGGTAPYAWDVTAGTVPDWATLSTSGLYTGVPDVTTAVAFTARVTDAVGANQTRAFTQVISPESLACSGASQPRTHRWRINGLTIEASWFRRPTPPLAVHPDCARKDERWDNTANGISYKACSNDPLTWCVSNDGVGTNVVRLADTATPLVNDLIIANDSGEWTRIQASVLMGLFAPTTTTTIPQTITLRADATDASMPATASFSEITSGFLHRAQVDFTNAVQMYVHSQQTAVAVTNPRLEIQYSANNGSSWTTSNASATLGTVANTYVFGTWTDIPVGMKGVVLIRVGFIGGNGSESPDVANIYVSVK